MRIYFDKQIFSHLFKNEKENYRNLLSKLNSTKEIHTFCYSAAHIDDLKNDTTPIKYDELAFMQQLVANNYLMYDYQRKITSPLLAYPKEAFESHETIADQVDFENLFEEVDTSLLDCEQKRAFDFAKKQLNDFTLDFSFLRYSELPVEYQRILDLVFPERKEKLSFKEFLNSSMVLLDSFFNEKAVYKTLRSYIDNNFNSGKFILSENDTRFSDDLKKSLLQQTFIEFVKNNLVEKDPSKISSYDFFTSAYTSLDLLGICKEPSKKVKFNNLLNDAQHSYYGAHCDVVISDDSGFLKKTRALYKLLDIHTEVIHVNEFINSYSFSLGMNEITSVDEFFNLLNRDINTNLILKTRQSIRFNRMTNTVKTINIYLGYFNRIDIIQESGKVYYHLYHQVQNYSNFIIYTEIEKVVNNAIKLFGTDVLFNGNFQPNEIREIKDNIWSGRRWLLKSYDICLEINQGTKELALTLLPI